jgi:chromosome segregation ATPase
MQIHIHVHNHAADFQKSIFSLLNKISMNQEELAQALSDLQAQTEKSDAELVTKIADLEKAVIDAGNVTPAVEAALANLKTSVQKVDDIVADAPATDAPGDTPIV